MNNSTSHKGGSSKDNKPASESGNSLTHILLLLLGARVFFLTIGIAFLFGEVLEVLLSDSGLNAGIIIRIVVVSLIYPCIVWFTTKWGERLVRRASQTHNLLVEANDTAQREIAERRNIESALRKNEEASQALASEYALLAEIGRIVSSSLEIEEIYERLMIEVKKLIPFDRVSIATLNDEAGGNILAYTSGQEVEGRDQGQLIQPEGTIAGEVIQERKSVLIQGLKEEEFCTRVPRSSPHYQAGMRSFLSAPIFHNNGMTGILTMLSKSENAFTQNHVNLIERVGTQIAGAIANSQLHISVQRESQERDVLAQIGRILGSSLEIEQVYEVFAEKVKSLIPFDSIAISLVDLQSYTFSPAYISGRVIPERDKGAVVPIDGTVVEHLVKTQEGIIVNVYDESEIEREFPGLKPSNEAGFKCIIGAPLISNDEVIGTLQFRSESLHAFSQHHLELADSVATQIAGTIYNAQLHEQRKKAENLAVAEAQEKAVLAEIGKTFGMSLDLESVYEHFASLVIPLTSFDRLTISLVDYERQCTVVVYHSGTYLEGRQKGDSVPLEGALAGKVVQSKEPVAFHPENLAELKQTFPRLESTYEAGFRSFMGIPLISNERVIGILQFRSRSENDYDESKVLLAESVGGQIAGFIANAQLHAKVQQEAKERATLATIGRIISSSLDIDDVFQGFADEVRNLVPFNRITISLIDEDGKAFTVPYSVGVNTPSRQSKESKPLAGTTTDEVLRRNSSVLLSFEEGQIPENSFPGVQRSLEEGMHSFLSVPLISKGQTIGVLHLRSLQPGAYDQHHVTLVENVASQIAGALANSRLHNLRMAAEVALRQSEYKYRHMVESAKDFVYTTDEDGKFTYVNSTATDVTGYDEAELLDLQFTDVIAQEWKKHVRKFYVYQVWNTSSENILEFPIVTKEGNLVWVEQSVTPLMENGKIVGFQGIGRDITKRKKVEEERERLISELREAIAKIKTLNGMLPICASCKKIRDDKGYWNQIESYISEHSGADFSHGICPECIKDLYPQLEERHRAPS